MHVASPTEFEESHLKSYAWADRSSTLLLEEFCNSPLFRDQFCKAQKTLNYHSYLWQWRPFNTLNNWTTGEVEEEMHLFIFICNPNRERAGQWECRDSSFPESIMLKNPCKKISVIVYYAISRNCWIIVSSITEKFRHNDMLCLVLRSVHILFVCF